MFEMEVAYGAGEFLILLIMCLVFCGENGVTVWFIEYESLHLIMSLSDCREFHVTNVCKVVNECVRLCFICWDAAALDGVIKRSHSVSFCDGKFPVEFDMPVL